MAQSLTAVNAKAGAGDAPGAGKINPSLVPGQSINDLGGPDHKNEKSTDDSTKLDPYKGAPGQVSGDPQQKGASAAGTDGGAPAPGKGKIGDNVLPGSGSHDGTNSRSDSSVSAGSPAPGKGKIGTNVLPNGQDTGKSKVAEHSEVDDTAAEALDELADGANATDDFKLKAKVIFESALNQKLQLEVARLEEEFGTRFESEITEIAEKVEGFLNYTSQQWLEENKLVVENGIRNELSESFMQGLRSLFEDHYVTLPDEKYDIFESMVAKLDDMENKLNEQIEANVSLSSQMSGFQRSSVLADVSWDLSEAGKEKLAGLSESVEFESEANYRQKLEILKESFTEVTASSTEEAYSGEYLEESAEALAPSVEEGMSSTMAAYARVLSRTSK
jgi:hypothetical protein